MLMLRFGRADLANVRFALSPLVEVLFSVRALEYPASRSIHLPWITSSRDLIDDRDLVLLHALQPTNAYTPDFVHPPPRSPLACIEDELAEMVSTPGDQVRAEICRAYPGGMVPTALTTLVQAPDVGLAGLADVIRNYWNVMIAPHWERLRLLLEGDVLYRARQIADGGIQHLFADIHPEAQFTEGTLRVDKRVEAKCDLAGRGLLFVPSAFVWPRLGALIEAPWQPTLIYPARGVGTLWEPGQLASPQALGDLMGTRRAGVLADLDAPRSTTELAHRLGLSPPSVSQHLSVLRRAGLVHSSRVGRVVLYARTPRGDGLLNPPTAEL